MTYTPPSVRDGNRRAKLDWWFKGHKEALALWLAPWLNPRRPEPRPIAVPLPSDYHLAIARWGDDPQAWPGWFCPNCEQRNSGWALECGRCERPRVVHCLSTHGGSGHAPGTYSIHAEQQVVCGACGAITPNPGWLPEWVKPR
jgi:hypothetical protein